MSKNYFEIKYNGPYKGVHTSLPEDIIGKEYSPYMVNMILKNGEIRPRPRQYNLFPGTPDGNPILIITSFQDSNNVFHTVAVTSLGLWQLNRNWSRQQPPTSQKTWSFIGQYGVQPGPNYPVASSVFINKFFWTNGGANLWQWDGITSPGAPALWKASTFYKIGSQIVDSNKNLQVANNSGKSGTVAPAWASTVGAQTIDNTGAPNPVITWTENGKNITNPIGFVNAGIVDATNGVTAGAYFLIELNSQLLMLNTIESTGGNFTQRIRWCPSGLPTIWDPAVNIGAGFIDELDVSDNIMGAFTVGTTAFILRTNGISELTSTGNGINPWAINHLWASDRGIGNVYPFGYASYGPLGIFISSDDIYNVSLGGFKKIGSVSRDSIYNDLTLATGLPIACIVPYYSNNYLYNHYRLAIPQGGNNVTWIYSLEDESWQREYNTSKNITGISRYSFIK
jgi:hypothetical protein